MYHTRAPQRLRHSSSLAGRHSPVQEEKRKNTCHRAVSVEEGTRLTALLRYLYLVGSRKLRSIYLEPKGGKMEREKPIVNIKNSFRSSLHSVRAGSMLQSCCQVSLSLCQLQLCQCQLSQPWLIPLW